MTRFLPVIVAGNPSESSSGCPSPLLSAILSVSGHRFHDPIAVVRSKWLDRAVSMVGDRAQNTAFVSMPDRAPPSALAAAGFLAAGMRDEKAPVVLIDARNRRAPAASFGRDVAASLRDVMEGAVVAFTNSSVGSATGDFVFLASIARAEYETKAPGILSYAIATLRGAMSKGNVTVAPNVPYIGRTATDPKEIFLQAADLRALRHVDPSIATLYSPWGGRSRSYEAFYVSAPT